MNASLRKLKAALLVIGLSFGALASSSGACKYSVSPGSASYTSGSGGGSFSVSVSSGCAWTATTTNSWLHTLSSGSGNGTVNYTVDANTGVASRSGTLVVADQTFTVSQSGALPTLGVALDNTNLVWVTDPNYPWSGTTSPTFDGVAAAVSGNRFVPNSASWLQTTVVGPGTLSFWWKVDSLTFPDLDHFEFDVGGQVQDQIAGSIDWNYRTYSIPPGTNTLTWQYVKDNGFNSGLDSAWLDQVIYTTNPPIGLAQALNTCGLDWTSGGNPNPTYWTGDTSVTHDGQAAARSGAVYTGQESWMQSTVTGATNINFWWKVSSQTNNDYLEFYTNAVLATRISGEVGWQSNYFRLPPTVNVVKWRFVRASNSSPQGQDCGWVDQVRFNPSPAPVIVYQFTNLVLSASATNCQAVVPDVTGPAYLQLADGCSSVTVTQMPPAGTSLPLGTSTVVLTAFGTSGNAVSCTNTLTVEDLTPPQLTLLGANPLTNQCQAAFVDPGATAVDQCAGVLVLMTNSTVQPQVPGVYSIQYVAVDSSGNAATNTRTVYMVDTQPPQLTCPPDVRVGTAPGQCLASGVALGTATASDNCAVAVVTNNAPNWFPVGTNFVTWTAVDVNGNVAIALQQVVVREMTPPIISTPMQSRTNQVGTSASFSASATACSAVTYQWYFNNVVLGGKTDSTLTLASVRSSDAGSYQIVAASAGGAATNLVAVLSVLSDPATILGGQMLSSGTFALSFTGPDGQNYQVLATTDLLPTAQWTVLTNGTFDANPATFLDTEATTYPSRFYRIASP